MRFVAAIATGIALMLAVGLSVFTSPVIGSSNATLPPARVEPTAIANESTPGNLRQLAPRQTFQLQRAIDLSQDGDTIQLAEGTYHLSDALEIIGKRNLTLEGVGEVWILVENLYDDVMRIADSTRITLRNLHARHEKPSEEYVCEGAVVAIERSSAVWIDGCELNGSGAVGVLVRSSNDLIVTDSYIHDNTLTAFMLDGADSVAIHRNTIVNNGTTFYSLDTKLLRASENVISNNQGSTVWSNPFTREILGE
ncbi:MAG: hypothetical protein HC925_01810 [Coleofasciculaceae cyanobacterium SM2_3_26]|nr:hypothetical protein [Coleofasciculaceae cyanobacterium SM2_3_26]